MGNLPPYHLDINQPAFTQTDMDIFGPFTISQGRGRNATVKVWGVIFTCLSTRAVYLDIAASLSMNHCLNVIEQFLATYVNKTKCLYSDNGKNFVGTNKAIQQMYDHITKQKYKRHFANKRIAWHFNTPLMSPQGSAWERMI